MLPIPPIWPWFYIKEAISKLLMSPMPPIPPMLPAGLSFSASSSESLKLLQSTLMFFQALSFLVTPFQNSS